MNLSDRDRQIIKDHVDRGEPIPPKYKLALFAGASEVELIQNGRNTAESCFEIGKFYRLTAAFCNSLLNPRPAR